MVWSSSLTNLRRGLARIVSSRRRATPGRMLSTATDSLKSADVKDNEQKDEQSRKECGEHAKQTVDEVCSAVKEGI